jgi:Pyruvate/2-oxoacid:ferredoxin oxidoreductase delta subunit
MNDDIYNRLADVMDRLPNGFPRTKSNVEIRILAKIFTPEEAALVAVLTGELEAVAVIADRVGMKPSVVQSRLIALAKRGLVWIDKREGKLLFRLLPFLVGIYETQYDILDHELAHLFEQYMHDGGAAGIMKPYPALQRVIPAQKALKSEWILPYDDVKTIIMSAATYFNQPCICRKERRLTGFDACPFPADMCLSFSNRPNTGEPTEISRDEALALLDKAESIGLVHAVSNNMKARGYIGYICNCCGCCCGILRGINDYGIGSSVAQANYYSVLDLELCSNCGACVGRCQVRAISAGEKTAAIDHDRCIGCGLCVTGCPERAIELKRKPDNEIITPPVDYAAWEAERNRNRGKT